MKNTLFTFLMFILTIPAYGLERDYVSRAKLTKEQETQVIALAEKCGIQKVFKISTHNMYPSPFRGIRVQGAEQTKGREVSYQVLSMSHGAWLEPGAKPGKDDARMGNFWAGKPYVRKQIILKVGKKEYRVGSIRNMTAEECEKILGKLLKGNYRHASAVEGRMLEQVGWDKPSSFSRREDFISVGFLHKAKDAGFFDLQIKMTGGEIKIEQMFQAIP